jgi:hypothetical protein
MWAWHEARKDCRLLNNSLALDPGMQAARERRITNRREPSMHSNSKLTGWIVGLVAVAIGIDVLATELPRVMPYLIVLAVVFIVIRLVLFYTDTH